MKVVREGEQMAAPQTGALHVRGLGKQKTEKLVARARRLGMTPQSYLKHLVEEDLAVSERAKSSSFEELLGPGREVDEAEVDELARRSEGRAPPRQEKEGLRPRARDRISGHTRHQHRRSRIYQSSVGIGSDSGGLPAAAGSP